VCDLFLFLQVVGVQEEMLTTLTNPASGEELFVARLLVLAVRAPASASSSSSGTESSSGGVSSSGGAGGMAGAGGQANGGGSGAPEASPSTIEDQQVSMSSLRVEYA